MRQELRGYTDAHYDYIGQLNNWSNLCDFFYAVQGGYSQYYQPSPMLRISEDEAESYAEKMQFEWEEERRHRSDNPDYDGAPNLVGLPLEQKLYLRSVLKRGGRSVNNAEVLDGTQ